MSETELNAAFSGKAVDGHYPSGATFQETYRADGSVAYKDRQRLSAGRWSLQADSFCTIYDDDPAGGCFRVHKESANCFEFYFVAHSELQARDWPSEPNWTARAWIRDQPSTCREGAAV
jgi:hypothetical protein